MKTKDRSLDFASVKSVKNAQNGINMVDLMMWLVIAALILAAAIQGIGYYQQAAYLYHVKNDVMGGATKVLSVSGIEHNGTIDQPIVDEGLAITDKTAQVVLVSDIDTNGKPMIRGTHPGIPGKEVDYFFYNNGIYSANTEYILPVGTVPSGSTSLATGGTLLPGFFPNGDWNHNGTPNSVDLPPAGTPVEDISSPGMGDGTSASTVGTLTGDGSGPYTPKSTSWLLSWGPPMSNTTTDPFLSVGKWSYNSTNRTAYLTMNTNGQFSGGVGGSWIYLIHGDIQCYDTVAKTYTTVQQAPAAILRSPYTSNPGPNSSAVGFNCGQSAPASLVPAQVYVRTATDGEWANYSLGRLGYVYSYANLNEGWVNPNVPQQ